MERLITVDTGSLAKVDDMLEKLDLIHEAGYRYFDLTLYWNEKCDYLGTRSDYVERSLEIKKHADKLGLKCFQSHSYFTTGTDAKAIQVRKDMITQHIKVTALMGGKMTVVHPIWELSLDENVEFFKYFENIARENNVKIAIENIWGVKDNKPVAVCSSTGESLKELLGKLNSDIYVVCLDIGHAEMQDLNTSAVEIISAVGDKIKTVHIHDNDKWADLHQIPYQYKIDFDTIFKELKKCGYDGPVNFEVDRCYSALPIELYVPTLEYLHAIGRYFRKILDE